MPLSPADPLPRRRIRVLDTELAYVDTGSGDPIVFLHGNPTSSYLWRNVIPHVAARGRCLAPDLVGMGESDKAPAGSYRFVDHARYLDGWFDALRLDRSVTLVVHDWGSALGFHWARRHPERVRGIAYMEAIVRPMTWNDWPEPGRMIFRAMLAAAGEEIVLVKNVFVERLLPTRVVLRLGPGDVERLAWAGGHDLPGDALGGGRGDRAGEDRLRRAPPAGERHARARSRGDGALPGPVPRVRRVAPAHPHLAAPDPAGRRARRRGRDHPSVRRLAHEEPRAEALRQRRPGLPPDRGAARLLPDLPEPAGGHGPRHALRPGGLARRDRPGRGGLRREAQLSADGPEPLPRATRRRRPEPLDLDDEEGAGDVLEPERDAVARAEVPEEIHRSGEERHVHRLVHEPTDRVVADDDHGARCVQARRWRQDRDDDARAAPIGPRRGGPLRRGGRRRGDERGEQHRRELLTRGAHAVL